LDFGSLETSGWCFLLNWAVKLTQPSKCLWLTNLIKMWLDKHRIVNKNNECLDHSPLSVLWRHQKVPQESCSDRDTELRKKKHVYGISVQQHLDMSILVSATMARERTYNKIVAASFICRVTWRKQRLVRPHFILTSILMNTPFPTITIDLVSPSFCLDSLLWHLFELGSWQTDD